MALRWRGAGSGRPPRDLVETMQMYLCEINDRRIRDCRIIIRSTHVLVDLLEVLELDVIDEFGVPREIDGSCWCTIGFVDDERDHFTLRGYFPCFVPCFLEFVFCDVVDDRPVAWVVDTLERDTVVLFVDSRGTCRHCS